MLSEEQRELRKVVRRWAEADVAPYAAEVDRDARFPKEAFKSFVSLLLGNLACSYRP